MLDSYTKLQEKMYVMLDKGDYMYNVTTQQHNLYMKVCKDTSVYADLYDKFCI